MIVTKFEGGHERGIVGYNRAPVNADLMRRVKKTGVMIELASLGLEADEDEAGVMKLRKFWSVGEVRARSDSMGWSSRTRDNSRRSRWQHASSRMLSGFMGSGLRCP